MTDRMCRLRSCAEPCWYCDSPVSRHDHDHAPIPARAGGTDTVIACPGCHDLKDRLLLIRWPLALVIMAIREIVDLGAMPDAQTTDWPDCWDDMSGHARVLWAKWAALFLGGADLEVRNIYDVLS